MSLQILIIIGVVVAAAFVFASAEMSPRSHVEYPYTGADALLTQGELAFQRILNSVKPERVCINSKVRLADLIEVDSSLNKSRRAGAFARIQSKHVDFVLCDSVSMKILCGIELHDKSHATERRTQRDDFVREAFAAAGVPYLEVKASGAYNPDELRKRLSKVLANQPPRLNILG